MDSGTDTLLRELEESLWRPETRGDAAHMRRLLDADFLEFGRSGRVYNLEATLSAPVPVFTAQLPLPGFTVREPAAGVALVTYVSRVETDGGSVSAARRSSLWVRHGTTWRLHFHQGTPI